MRCARAIEGGGGDVEAWRACGRCAADRYRAPLVNSGMADDAVFAKRRELLHDPMPKCMVVGSAVGGCGFVGIGASSNGSGVRLRTRKLAD